MVARWPTAVRLGLSFVLPLAAAQAVASGAPVKAMPADTPSGPAVLDPTAVEQLSLEDARQLTASAGEVLALPRVRNVSVEVARALATCRDQTRTCTYKVCVPVAKEKTMTYSVMVPYTEEITRDDGTKVSVTKCRPETRTKTYTVTVCVPEERTHACPLTLQLDGLVSPKAEVLAELAKHDGHLHLNGLKALSCDEARQLAAHEGGSLVLNGLASFDTNVAEILATHAGDLSLNGIRTLSANTARALCKSKHGLSCDGLTDLPDDVAAELAMHEGGVSLKGVTRASAQAIQALRGRPVALPQELLSEQAKEKE